MHLLHNGELVWLSKSVQYERPYDVIGAVELTGPEQAPKDICRDRIKGTRKGSE